MTTPGRMAMDSALRSAFTHSLRPVGFSGSFPHLRRISDTQIDLLTVQHNKYGGSFVVEVANCAADGMTTSWGKNIVAAKVTAHDVPPYGRVRIGKQPAGTSDPWFVYGRPAHESGTQPVRSERYYRAIADQVILAVQNEAEPFWRDYAERRLS